MGNYNAPSEPCFNFSECKRGTEQKSFFCSFFVLCPFLLLLLLFFASAQALAPAPLLLVLQFRNEFLWIKVHQWRNQSRYWVEYAVTAFQLAGHPPLNHWQPEQGYHLINDLFGHWVLLPNIHKEWALLRHLLALEEEGRHARNNSGQLGRALVKEAVWAIQKRGLFLG